MRAAPVLGKVLGLAAMVLAVQQAQGANWQAIEPAATSHVRFYIDGDSIRRQGPWHRARLLYDFAEPQFNEELGTTSRSYIVDSLIDCRGQRLATMRMQMHADRLGRGKPQVRTAPEKTLKWTGAESGPINRAVIHAVCKRVSGKPEPGKEASEGRHREIHRST